MCLAVPGKVISVSKDSAEVDLGGVVYSAGLQLTEDIAPGDWVIVHSGYVLDKMDEADALKSREIFKELSTVTQ